MGSGVNNLKSHTHAAHAGGFRVQRSLAIVLIASALVLTGCSWFGGKHKTYITSEGYHGSVAKNGPFSVDAVYMSDTTYGIEGVVRLSWWQVFSVTVQNRSRGEVSFESNRFTLVDAAGNRKPALSLDATLEYRSHLMGPLMDYQRQAIRRSIWTADPIPPGGFAVGYLFFPRGENNIPPWKLILDPRDGDEEDEIIAVFPQLREEYAAELAAGPPATEIRASEPPPPVAVDTTAAAEAVDRPVDEPSVTETEAVEAVPVVESQPEQPESVENETTAEPAAQEESTAEEAPTSEVEPVNP